MRSLRVLVAVPPQTDRALEDPVVNAALARIQGRGDRLFGLAAMLQPRLPFEVDESFGVMVVAPPGERSGRLAAAFRERPEAALRERRDDSPKLLVRGILHLPNQNGLPEVVELAGRGEGRVYLDHELAPALTCGKSRPFGKADRVRRKLRIPALHAAGLDGSGIAVAIVDSGIYLAHLEKKLARERGEPVPVQVDPARSWNPPSIVTKAFRHRIGHGTASAYDVLIAAPKATLIDVPMLRARAPGDHTVQGTVSAVLEAYEHLLQIWAYGPRLGLSPPPPYKALVVNNSWGIYHPGLDFPPGHPNRFADNPNHPLAGKIDEAAAAGFDIVFSAGNCGEDCPSPACLRNTTGAINGAAAYASVLSVAGCDLGNARVGYSAKGPSIAGMPQQKPDLSGYTHFIGSGAQEPYRPDAGTSAAAAVVSGCIAALRTKVPPAGVAPGALFDVLRTTARSGAGASIGGVWDPGYGFGVISPRKAAKALGVFP